MSQMAGKVVWVTGAGSGIGEAAAIALAKQRAIVVLTGRRGQPLQEVARRIADAGGTAHVQAADLGRAQDAQRVGAFIKDELGRLDILVNNAGVNIVDRSWATLTPEGVDQVIAGNLASAFYCVPWRCQ